MTQAQKILEMIEVVDPADGDAIDYERTQSDE